MARRIDMLSKLVDIKIISSDSLRNSMGRIAFVKGVFDLTHAGHVALFKQAKSMADTLIVAVATDEMVKRKKGESRPILNINSRIAIISEFSCVDWIIEYDDLYNALASIRPNVFCASHFNSLEESEKSQLNDKGVEFVIIPKPSCFMSTSQIISKLQMAVE